VTIFGQSSGGTSIYILLGSPLASGLFHRAWLMSSSYVLDTPLAVAEKQNQVFSQRAGCSPKTDDGAVSTEEETAQSLADEYECLQSLSIKQVLDATPYNVDPWWAGPMLLDLPTPNWIGGQIAIVDGYVLPIPPQQALATGKGNDVPVVFGSTAQENDFAPVATEVASMNWDEWVVYITKRLTAFSPALVEPALKFYPPNSASFTNPLVAYESMASDIGNYCGNTWLARSAAVDGQFRSPVYHYMLTARPSNPVTTFVKEGWKAHYSFHTLDIVALCATEWVFLDPIDMNILMLRAQLRIAFHSFITTGTIPSSMGWPAWSSSSTAAQPTYLLASSGSSTAFNYKSDECAFWWSNDFQRYGWSN